MPTDDIVIKKDEAELIGQLMQASLNDTFATHNQLIANLDREAAEAIVTVKLIREGVTALLYGDCMPTPAALQRALWPHPFDVDERTKESLKERRISVHDGDQNT